MKQSRKEQGASRHGLKALAVLAFALTTSGSWANQDLAISPTYISMDNRNRSEEVLVINRRNSPMTVRLSHRFMRPKPSGGYEEVTALYPEEQPADELLRYAPRQVTIMPGKAQTIRLMARKPANLPEGEYRTHLFVKEVPKAASTLEEEGDAEHISVKLRAILGISIPVLIKHGNLETRATLANLALAQGSAADTTQGQQSNGPILRFSIHNHGNATPRGDLIAEYQPASGGEAVRVGYLKAVSVLYPLKTRQLEMPLNVPPPLQLNSGFLRLRYMDVQNKAGGKQLIATSELQLN